MRPKRTTARLQFDSSVRLTFHAATITSDADLLACREFENACGLTDIAAHCLKGNRIAVDPAMRSAVGGAHDNSEPGRVGAALGEGDAALLTRLCKTTRPGSSSSPWRASSRIPFVRRRCRCLSGIGLCQSCGRSSSISVRKLRAMRGWEVPAKRPGIDGFMR